MKSTKQDIMDALNEAKAELARRSSIIADPTAVNRKQEEDACIDAAAKDVEANIFSAEMNDKYSNLVTAIALLEGRLKDQYEIEAALLNLVTVTNAAKQLRLDMDEDYAKRKAEIDADLADLKQQNRDAMDCLREEYAEKKRQAEQQHEREEEEYKYERDRSRKIEEDDYADKMLIARKELDAVKAEAAAIDAENEAKKAEVENMRAEIESFPKKLEEQYQAGYTEGEKAAGKDYGYKKAMADKDHEYQIREKDNEIRRLEDTVDSQARKIESLEDKLDAAYAQIQALAAKTVESNGSIKVISGSSDNSNKR